MRVHTGRTARLAAILGFALAACLGLLGSSQQALASVDSASAAISATRELRPVASVAGPTAPIPFRDRGLRQPAAPCAEYFAPCGEYFASSGQPEIRHARRPRRSNN